MPNKVNPNDTPCITSCIQCTNYRDKSIYDSPEGYECVAMWDKGIEWPRNKLHDIHESIPDWCPLPDYVPIADPKKGEIKVGKFFISKFPPPGDRAWLEKADGEGMELNEALLDRLWAKEF